VSAPECEDCDFFKLQLGVRKCFNFEVKTISANRARLGPVVEGYCGPDGEHFKPIENQP
jgi:hypothetical protein